METNKLDLLFPPFRAQIYNLLRRLSLAGVELHPFETWRSNSRQDELFVAGRSKATAGRSFHQYGLAADLVGGGPGKWTWDGVDWAVAGVAAAELGIVWGGDWQFSDKAHFQYRTSMTIESIKSAVDEGGILYLWNILLK